MTMITPSYLGETIEYSSLHACRSTLEDPTYGREAVDKLIELMRGKLVLQVDGDGPPKMLPIGASTQLAAAEALLDRGYGKPPQAVEIAGKDGGPVVTENSAYDLIRSRLDGIAERLREGEAPSRLN